MLISHVSIARSFGDESAGAAREGARKTRWRRRRLSLDDAASRFLTSGGAAIALPVIRPQMRDQIFFREKLASAVVFRAREHRARFPVRFQMGLEIARIDGLPARGTSLFLPLGPSDAVALLEVAPGFETGVEDGVALGMKLAAVETVALFDVAPQVTAEEEGAVAAGLSALERQHARMFERVTFQLPMFFKGFTAGGASVGFEPGPARGTSLETVGAFDEAVFRRLPLGVFRRRVRTNDDGPFVSFSLVSFERFQRRIRLRATVGIAGETHAAVEVHVSFERSFRGQLFLTSFESANER